MGAYYNDNDPDMCMPMTYATVASGIDAPALAWDRLGWRQLFSSEIEKFPCAVLAHHYPDVPNLGDMNHIHEHEAFKRPNVIMAGTPCQSFSIAGLRAGLADPHGNLALVFLATVDRLRPTWVVWENVPGVLSSGGGRDFGTILGALGQLGYGWAYRILDAQYFGLAQRRRRVFLVGHIGDWRRAAAVLFERESLSGHPSPSRAKGKEVAGTLGSMPKGSGTDHSLDTQGAFIPMIAPLITGPPYGDCESREGLLVPGITGAVSAKWAKGTGGPSGNEAYNLIVAHSLRGEGFDASEDGSGRGTPIIAFDSKRGGGEGEIVSTLRSMPGDKPNAGGQVAIAYNVHSANSVAMQGSGDAEAALETDVSRAVDTAGFTANQGGTVVFEPPQMSVRRLTPVECERLMDFPDNYTRIPYRGKPAEQCPDGPRYRAIGNSIPRPMLEWLGRRIEMVEG